MNNNYFSMSMRTKLNALKSKSQSMASLLRKSVLLLVCSILFMQVQAQYVTNGTAYSTGNNCFVLTPDNFGQSGSVWYQNYMLLTYDFDMTFQVYLGYNDGGADGIAFVMQPLSTGAGSAGGGLGYAGINPSIAVEYDTWQNDDPWYDHISIQRNGDPNSTGTIAGPVQASAASTNIEDNQNHTTRITWNATTKVLSVWFDGNLRTTYTGDLVNNFFGGNPLVYWGFTGATGGAKNPQSFCVTSATFRQALTLTVSSTNVTCPGANNGTATVTSITGGEPPYIFNGWYNGATLVSTNTFASSLAPGTYTARYTDASAATTSKSVVIGTNPDVTKPTLSIPANISTTISACSNTASVTIGNATATDNCGTVSITNNAPSSFPVGTTTITWTATDPSR